jgi:hypothetical protein
MSSTGDRLEFAAPSTHSEATVEDFMPILIRHPNNKITLPGEAEITAFRPEMMPFFRRLIWQLMPSLGFYMDPYKHC